MRDKPFRVGVYLLCCLLVASCSPKETVLFEENFVADSLFWQHWSVEAEVPMDSCEGSVLPTQVELIDGTLHLRTAKGLTLWNNQPFQGNLCIQFESCVIDDGCPYDRLSDMNCFWMASDPLHPSDLKARSSERGGSFPQYYALSMYYLGYGGNHNTTTRFRRYEGCDRAVVDASFRPAILQEYTDEAHLLTPNKWYRNRIEVLNGRVRYFIDDECIVDYVDEHPLEAGWFGFRTTQSHVAYRCFKVILIESE